MDAQKGISGPCVLGEGKDIEMDSGTAIKLVCGTQQTSEKATHHYWPNWITRDAAELLSHLDATSIYFRPHHVSLKALPFKIFCISGIQMFILSEGRINVLKYLFWIGLPGPSIRPLLWESTLSVLLPTAKKRETHINADLLTLSSQLHISWWI